MTKNTLEYLRQQEQKRSNLANERIARDKLAEEMANNLRNFKINITKNQIQKLANDQLNSREISKIIETARNNLAREMETERNNRRLEMLKELDIKLSNLKPTGKSVSALLTSYALNNHMLSAYGLDAPIGGDINAVWDLLNDRVNAASEMTSSWESNRTGFNHPSLKPVPEEGFTTGRDALARSRNNKAAAARMFKYETDKDEIYLGGQKYSRSSPIIQKAMEKLDERDGDVINSQTKFKGGNANESIIKSSQTINQSGNSSSTASNYSNTNQVPGYVSSSSAKVYYSPRTKESKENNKEGGPGIGIAFN